MQASSAEQCKYGGEERWAKYWARFGCSPYYGPFSLGVHFQTYESLISVIINFFSGREKPRITEAADTELVDKGVCLYLEVTIPSSL
jgi:hypothetical protein